MKLLKDAWAVTAICFSTLCAGTVSAATNVVLLAGESFTVIGSGADGLNVRGSTIDAQGGSTLVFKPTDGTTYVNCWYSIQATNGIVTLDVSQDTAAGYSRILRAVYASGTGGFRVKGGTEIRAGRPDDNTAAAPFDAANFGFVDNAGNATAGTVHFIGTSCIVHVPAADQCAWAIDSSDVALAGTNALNLAEGEPCALSHGFNLFTDTAIPASSPIQVASGNTVTIKPSIPAPFGSSVDQTSTTGANANHFVLGSEATLAFAQGLTNFVGTVSGNGLVTVDRNRHISRVNVSGDACGLSLASGLVASVPDGGSAILAADSGTLLQSDGGTIVLSEGWRNSVALWFDPSQTGTCHNIGRTTGYPGQYDTFYTNRYPLVEALDDCRSSQTAWRLRNNRLNTSGTGSAEYYQHMYPYLVTNGLNGLSYICCGEYSSAGTRQYTRNKNGTESSVTSTSSEQRRLMIQPAGSESNYESYNMKSVVMVFGSAFGGGGAMLGTSTKVLKRGTSFDAAHGAGDPIATGAGISVWLDGRSVNPATTRFNASGWQVVTVTCDSGMLPFTALGMPGSYSDSDWQKSGGQCYGEILMFTNAISDVQRVAAESYLARKWGLSAQYAGSDAPRLNLSGTGSVDASALESLTFGGNFTGTLTLDGGRLAIPDEVTPYDEATLPSEGRVGWFDPSVRSCVVTHADNNAADNRPDQITVVWDREAVAQTAGAKMLTGGASRQPTLRREARGIGPVMNWIDFNHFYANSMPGVEDYPGNDLRVSAWAEGFRLDASNWNNTYDSPIATRTAFFVQDSCRGGGNTVMDTVNGSGQIPGRTGSDPSANIWNVNTSANIRDGLIHLNGSPVAYTDGFTGRPEVFSFATVSTTFNAGYFANYNNTENANAQNGEILGEILLYDREVTGDERLGIEAYLMGKWLGWLPTGASDASGVTVAGTGTVVAPSAARLPSFAADFTGDIQVAGDEFSFTYDASKVPALGGNVVSAPSANLTLPAACTVKVAFVTPPAVGTYALVTSAGFTSPVAWTLTTSGTGGGRPMRLRTTGGNVYLDVFPSGFTVIFR